MVAGMPQGLAVEAIVQITDEVLEAFTRLLPQLSTSATVNRQLLERLVVHDATELFVARLDGSVVGALTLVAYPIPTGLRAHIDDVVVDASARGRGVGEALVAHALVRASAAGAKTVDLTSRPGRDAAIRLYLRLGFVRRDSHLYRFQIPDAGNSTA